MVDVPAELNPDKLSIHCVVTATGVQIYRFATDPNGARSWRLHGPEAELFDAQGRCVGRHYAGPTWEGFDGGTVKGTVKTSRPAPDAGAIPWLLLDIVARAGTGTFTHARAIVRMATSGGAAPADTGDPSHAGQELRVPYGATYVFLN